MHTIKRVGVMRTSGVAFSAIGSVALGISNSTNTASGGFGKRRSHNNLGISMDIGARGGLVELPKTLGPSWVHEIKHDGYRLMARKQGDRVRLYTRNGHDWAARYPTIARAIMGLKVESILLDGEVVVCDDKGVADFDRLHSRCFDKEAIMYAFDLLELNGAEVGHEPFADRKKKLAKLLRKPSYGLMLNEHTDYDGELIFQHACKMGLEGIVSKRRDLLYRSGRAKSWIKVKNPHGPAMQRAKDVTF